MAVWSTQAANKIITLSLQSGGTLTHMQIQKLVYISHGWSLAVLGERLTLDDPEAWSFGPVYRLIWERLGHTGRFPVTATIPESQLLPYSGAVRQELDRKASEIIEKVFNSYGELQGFQLSALTHREGTPWRQVYADGQGRNDPVYPALIREHFVGLAKKNAEG